MIQRVNRCSEGRGGVNGKAMRLLIWLKRSLEIRFEKMRLRQGQQEISRRFTIIPSTRLQRSRVMSKKQFIFGPPRPDAFFVALDSLADLPAVQTLLYSIVSTSSSRRYPPEVVVQINVERSKRLDSELKPFSSRLLYIHQMAKRSESKICEGMESYETIIYLNNNCLVLKDLCYLFDEYRSPKPATYENIVIASSSVHDSLSTYPSLLIMKPSLSLTDSISNQCLMNNSKAKQLNLNCLSSRESENELNNAKFIEFDDPKKPWYNLDFEANASASHKLWMKFYNSSKTSTLRLEKIKGLEKNEKLQHIRITKRFKELRKLGVSTVMAMDKAREENFGKGTESNSAIGKKVGAMFGAS